MPDKKTGLKPFIVGKYVCPETDELIAVPADSPLAELDCPVIIEKCPSCGERHEVCCDDLLDTEEGDLE